jgi:hypothetical protein
MIRSIVAICLFLAAAGAHATSGKSAKKLEADRHQLRAPQVVEEGDNAIGLRAAQGDVFRNNPMVGFNYEHMVSPNFGIGGQYHYSTYTHTIRVGELKGTYEYDAHVYLLYGSYHFDLFKVRNLDTYISAGFGRTVLKSNWTSNSGLADAGSADSSSTYLLGYVNARYFINSNFAFTGSVGTPIGTLALGMDYLF